MATLTYSNSTAYQNTLQYRTGPAILAVTFFDGSSASVAVSFTDRTYHPTASDTVLFQFLSSPTYIPAPSDTVVFDFTPKANPQYLGIVSLFDGTQFFWNDNIVILPTISMFDGSEMDWSLKTTVIAYIVDILSDGSTMSWSFSTAVDLTAPNPGVFNDGSTLTYTLTINPGWHPTPVFYDGSTANSSLATEMQLFPTWYDGSTAAVTFTTFPPANPNPNFYDGAAVILPTIAAQQSLPTLTAYDGTSFIIGTVTNLANWYIYDGTQLLDLNLSTRSDLTAPDPGVFNDGSTLYSQLTTFPSGPLASSWVMYEGSTFEPPTASTYPAVFFQVTFFQDMYLQVDFSNQTHSFDLTKQCAVQQPDSYFYWKDPDVVWLNLTNSGTQQYPSAVTTGFSSYMNVTVAFKETLTPNPFYDGSTAGIYNFWPLLDNVGMGSFGFGMTVTNLAFTLDVPLCFGNFIPAGDAVSADLAATDDTTCTADQMYDGSTMLLKLENNQQEATVWSSGESMWSNLVVPTGWIFNFYDGSSMFVPSYVEFNPEFSTGEFLTVAFKPISVTFFDGASMTAPPPNTSYTVTFIDIGCLQNEYNPEQNASQVTGPDGIPLSDTPSKGLLGPEYGGKYGAPYTANIELQPFYHQILAECFG